jgi:hypothetical protein
VGKVRKGPNLRAAYVRHTPGGFLERQFNQAVGHLSGVYGLQQEAFGDHYERPAVHKLNDAQYEGMELGSPEDRPRHRRVLNEPLGLQLRLVVEEGITVDPYYRDV